MDPIIILGTGLAGYTVAREFRKYDPATPLLFITRDDGAAYSKPMLSNALAMKKTPAALANFSADTMAAQLNATIRTGLSVDAVDTARHQLTLAGGETLRYSRLVLALGAEPRRVPVAGTGAADILSINDLADYARFRSALEGCRDIAILGAGLIGCEFANDLTSAGYQVTLIDPAGAPLSRLLPLEVGDVFARGLREHGVRFHLGCGLLAVQRATSGYALLLDDGRTVEADLVLSAIGLLPRTGLAQAAGIAIDRGVRTDLQCRTSAPDVYALGDCASIEGRFQPYVLPLMHAARALARTLSGTPTSVEFPVMPIVVKTPAIPAVVAPPPDEHGVWTVEAADSALLHAARAVCRDQLSGRTTGFSLLGAAVQGKAELLKEMAQPKA